MKQPIKEPVKPFDIRQVVIHLNCGGENRLSFSVAKSFSNGLKGASIFCSYCQKNFSSTEFVYEGTKEKVGA